jgi:hypothetical protein
MAMLRGSGTEEGPAPHSERAIIKVIQRLRRGDEIE